MNVSKEAPQSIFLTVLAWIIIVLSSVAALVGVMQNVMVNFLMPTMIANSPVARGETISFTLLRVSAFLLLVFVAFMAYCGYALQAASFAGHPGRIRHTAWCHSTSVVAGPE